MFSFIVVKVNKVLFTFFGEPFSLFKELEINEIILEVFFGLTGCRFVGKKSLNPFLVHDKFSDPWMVDVFGKRLLVTEKLQLVFCEFVQWSGGSFSSEICRTCANVVGLRCLLEEFILLEGPVEQHLDLVMDWSVFYAGNIYCFL